jgi:hypothetical protein
MEKCFVYNHLNKHVCECFELANNKKNCKWLDKEEMCHYRNEECENFIPEDNPYPLCNNMDCPEIKACNISAHMSEEGYWRE